MHPRPGLYALKRSDDEVQLGHDPRWSVRITGLPPSDITNLLLIGRDPDETHDAIGRLTPATRNTLQQVGALLPKPPPAGADAQYRAWSNLLPDADPTPILDRRKTATIGIVGLGRTGLRLAQCLTASGIGRLILDDNQLITPDDLDPGGYTTQHLGERRRRTAAQLLKTSTGNGAITIPSNTETLLNQLDAIAVITHGAIDPTTTWRLVGEGLPHLPIIFHEASVNIGPLILPGTTACLRCIDLARRDEDPAWPLMSAHLNAATVDRGEEALLAALSAPLAANQLLALVDNRTTALAGSSALIELPDAVPKYRAWSQHPECGCNGPLLATPANPTQAVPGDMPGPVRAWTTTARSGGVKCGPSAAARVHV